MCDLDRRLFLKRLGEVCEERSWRCLAYCLMTNHYHLVLRTDRAELSPGMHDLNARYAIHFNRAYEATGHVFQGRYHDHLIDTDEYLLQAVRYVELNPVRAGLCNHASRWPWNSYLAVIGERIHFPWFDRAAVLSLFSPDTARAAQLFAQFVDADSDWRPDLRSQKQRVRDHRDQEIRRLHATGKHSLRELARCFDVSVGTVARILKCSTMGPDPNVER